MPSPRYDQEIIPILAEKILPWWERHGLNRLIVSANTIEEFREQGLPPAIEVSVKQRQGRKILVRGPRYYDNTSFKIALWPEDHQETLRYPALACVLRGQADFHIADYVVHCPQGHFIVFDANVPQPTGDVPHFVDGDFSRRYCEVLWLLAPPGTSNRISAWICHSEGDKHWLQGLFDYCWIDRSEVLVFFNTFLKEITERPTGFAKLAEASLHAFLLLFIRELSEGRFSLAPAAARETDDLPQDSANPIDLAVQYIDHHLNQQLTTQSLANAVYMSRSNFVRRFQQQQKQSFNRYVTERRLEEAKRLMREETWSLAIVCRLIGLSPAQLRRLFQREYGMSPSQWAAKMKEMDNMSEG